MKIHPITVAIASALCFATPYSIAQQSSNDPLESITVVSSRVAIPLKELATSVEIIDEQEIAALANFSVADILRTATSVGVSNAGGQGKTTTLRIRGEEGYRTKLFIDGVPLSDPSAPQVAPIFDDILSNHIESIEILRGSQGLAYGADAGGIISINTHSSDDGFHGSVGALTGRYNTTLVNADLAFGNKRGGIFLAAADLNTDGFNAQTVDVDGDADGYENTSLHLKGQIHLTSNLSAKIVLRQVDGENEYDGCFDNVTFAPIHACKSQSQNTTSRLSVDYQTDFQSHSVGIAKTDVKRDFFSNEQFSYASEGETEKFDYVGRFENDNQRVVYGVDIEKQRIIASNLERYQRGAFAEYQHSWQQSLYVNIGLRHDDNDTFGSENSIRLGGAYLLPLSSQHTVKLKSTYGTGFRAPSLYEQDYNDGPFAYGDAAGLQLKQEQSKGFDFGAEFYSNSGLSAELVVFKQTIENEIFYDLVGYQGYLQGSGQSRSKGFELSAKQPLSNAHHLWANYTYNDTETAAGDQRLRRPRHSANVGLRSAWLDDQLTVNIHIRAVRDAYDIGNTKLDSYVVANLSANYKLTDNITATTKIENLFDREYQEVATYNTSGSAAYFAIQARY